MTSKRTSFRISRGFRRDTSGSVATIFGLAFIPMMVTIGVGIDYARATTERAMLQSGVDAAALAGILQIRKGETVVPGRATGQSGRRSQRYQSRGLCLEHQPLVGWHDAVRDGKIQRADDDHRDQRFPVGGHRRQRLLVDAPRYLRDRFRDGQFRIDGEFRAKRRPDQDAGGPAGRECVDHRPGAFGQRWQRRPDELFGRPVLILGERRQLVSGGLLAR